MAWSHRPRFTESRTRLHLIVFTRFRTENRFPLFLEALYSGRVASSM